ncbi:uncharacterized protein BO97DRAFT_478639 [Aspergillus homomorphus CBS 101889]|uniref:Uncharacterized protein n=1 Tax=Aspergillus homomorphus (strain CBS 101889) TaxID=1450537 RepID=A0A395HVC6_ASPHC|nr:hypothetical protein BO97DRAFT_478639 [Aspergillus homomorphus CBS 101889]RAL11335.1 hypothetical protein BO97DRAFT_478639 [Aspergillus homomorphus CBS 101889]
MLIDLCFVLIDRDQSLYNIALQVSARLSVHPTPCSGSMQQSHPQNCYSPPARNLLGRIMRAHVCRGNHPDSGYWEFLALRTPQLSTSSGRRFFQKGLQYRIGQEKVAFTVKEETEIISGNALNDVMSEVADGLHPDAIQNAIRNMDKDLKIAEL